MRTGVSIAKTCTGSVLAALFQIAKSGKSPNVYHVINGYMKSKTKTTDSFYTRMNLNTMMQSERSQT